jgi:hypothetical protein
MFKRVIAGTLSLCVFFLASLCMAGYSGKYEYQAEGCGGSMEVWQSDRKMRVSIETVCGRTAHLCSYEGQGVLSGNQVRLHTNEEPECEALITFGDGFAKVESNYECRQFCGLNGHFAGKYLHAGKAGREKPAHSLFKGTINKRIRIQMKLGIQGNRLSGTYFYEKYRTDIPIQGTIDSQKKVVINEFDEKGNQTGVFKGKFTSARRIEGIWSKPNGSKAMPFVLELQSDQNSSSAKLPRLPYVRKPACPVECCSFGKWTLDKSAKLYARPSFKAKVITDLKPGRKIEAITGEIHTSRFGEILILKDVKIQGYEGDQERSLNLKRGDSLYELEYLGEGWCSVWYQGKTYETDCWFEDTGKRWGKKAAEMQMDWWVEIKVPSKGLKGWIVNPEADGIYSC